MEFKSYLEQLKESNPEAYKEIYKEIYTEVLSDVLSSNNTIEDEELETAPEYLATDDIYEYDPNPDDLLGNDFDIDKFDPAEIGTEELNVCNDLYLNFDQIVEEYYNEYLPYKYAMSSKTVCDVYPISLWFSVFYLLNSKGYKLSSTSLIQSSDLSELHKMNSSDKLLYFVVNTEEKLFEIYEYKDQFSHLILSYNDNSIMHKLYEDQINSDNDSNNNPSL